MHPTVKAETYEQPHADDVYAAAALALEQAQRALSTMRAKPTVATIPVAEAEKKLNELRATVAAMQGAAVRDGHEIDELRRVAGEARKERDVVRSELERRLREIANMKEAHERERPTIVAMRASLTKDLEALQAERETLAEDRERLNAQRAAIEADNQVLLDNRNIIAQNLQRMGQLVQRDPLPPTPEAVARIRPTATGVAAPSVPDMVSNGLPSVPSCRRPTSVSTSIPSRNRPSTQISSTPSAPEAHDSDSDSHNPPKRQRTGPMASPGVSLTARPTSAWREIAPGPSSRTSPHSRIQGSNRGQPLAPRTETSSRRIIKTKVLALLTKAKNSKRILTKEEVDRATRLLQRLNKPLSDQGDDSDSDDEPHSDYSNQDEIDELAGKDFHEGFLSHLVKFAANRQLRTTHFTSWERDLKRRRSAIPRPPPGPVGIHRTRAKIYSL
ncbi:hypothetical protein B0H11DRAFT_2126434 [Mycena galericulata]|nr:hypothetical protein B0H11DRAFT_2126434 [Mycena galericulata]